jgi:uncharacterized protein (TIGR03085 family)
MTIPARIEREKLCDLMLEVGPEAPTLAGEWTTRDLAAHLVIRERRPDAAGGILFKPFASYGEKVRLHEAERDYDELVERVRTGPPVLSPMRVDAVDRMVNTIEFFVHHEDVRRGSPGWTVRPLDDELERDLYASISRGVRMLSRQAPAGIVLEPDGHDPIVAKKVAAGQPSVTVSGPLGELVLFMYGRQAHTEAEVEGPDDAVAAVRTASFGI